MASRCPLVELINSLETIAGVHGVGRIDMVENRLVGIKSREIYEAPAGLVLHQAHRELEGLVIPKDLSASEAASVAGVRRHRLQRPLVLADALGDRRVHAEHPAARDRNDPAEALQRAIAASWAGSRTFALYEHGLATYDEGDTFDHSAAEGFIKIWGLPVETAAKNARRRAAKDADRAAAPGRVGWRSSRWRISGQDVSAASPIPSPSSSGRPFDSTGDCSKTT